MPSYNLTFHLNDGSNTSSVYEISDGGTFPAIDYFGWSREGYNFLYWNVRSDGSSSYKYQAGDTVPTNFSMLGIEDIYAIWEVVIPTVTYITNSTELTSVADAIRAKGGTSASLVYPTGFVSAIGNIPAGIGEVTFSGSLSITNNTNIWQYLGIDSVYGGDSFCIIVLQNLYVRNTAMNFTSEYCVFFNENCIDQPSQSPVADSFEDDKYYLIPWVEPWNSTAYIRTVGNDSLSAIITKIIKVQRA